MGVHTHHVEEDMMDEKMLEGNPEESYTAIRSVVTVPTAAPQEASKHPGVDELREWFRMFQQFGKQRSTGSRTNTRPLGQLTRAVQLVSAELRERRALEPHTSLLSSVYARSSVAARGIPPNMGRFTTTCGAAHTGRRGRRGPTEIPQL